MPASSINGNFRKRRQRQRADLRKKNGWKLPKCEQRNGHPNWINPKNSNYDEFKEAHTELHCNRSVKGQERILNVAGHMSHYIKRRFLKVIRGALSRKIHRPERNKMIYLKDWK